MSNGVQISIPMGDVDKLFKAMQYASDNLSIDMGKAMKQGVNRLISSLGASTKVSPKYRKVIERPVKGISGAAAELIGGEKAVKYGITGWFGKPRVFQTRMYENITKKQLLERHAKIKRSGLAKMTWKLTAKAINARFIAGFESSVAGITKSIAQRHIEAKANYKGQDIFAEIHNSLPYINEAFKSRGKQTVDTAFDRAASGLIKSVDKQIERRLLKAA